MSETGNAAAPFAGGRLILSATPTSIPVASNICDTKVTDGVVAGQRVVLYYKTTGTPAMCINVGGTWTSIAGSPASVAEFDQDTF